MSDYPMLISNKLHSFRNFPPQSYNNIKKEHNVLCSFSIGQVTDALCYVTFAFIYTLSPILIPSICVS